MADNKQSLLDMPRIYLDSMQFNPKFKWYKPLLAMMLTGFVYAVFVTVILGIGQALQLPEFMSGGAAQPGAYLKTNFGEPLEILFMSLGVAALIPAVGISLKAFGLGGFGGLSSVAGHLRWDRMAKLAAPIFVLTGILICGEKVIEMLLSGSVEELTHPVIAPMALLSILAFVPFQCAAEEYVYRGLLQQALGAWIPSIAAVVVLQSIAFGFSHGYNLLGNVEIILSGIVWGWLTVKTGGLEASICLHAANNIFIFAMSSLFVTSGAVMTEVDVATFAFDVFVVLVAAAVTYYVCKKNGYFLEGDKSDGLQIS